MDINAPDLVKKWRSIVNNNVAMGRDASLLKKALVELTPEQILYGMYQYENERTISIPMFLRQQEDWVIDEEEAEIELAVYISRHSPPEYFIWQDLKDEEGTYAYQHSREAFKKVQAWARRVIG